MPPIARAHSEYLERLQTQLEAHLRRSIPAGEPELLYAPAHYVLEAGGKRLRPLLLLLACEACGGRAEQALPAAVAMELFHTFTLVHDDIMDRSPTRRGRPTVHVRWGLEAAILTGDLLMGTSYFELSRVPETDIRPLLACLHEVMLRLCEGQTLDKQFETRQDVSPHEYWDMVDRKTGALLAGALEIGARLGSASEAQIVLFRAIGRALGRAFQLQDDWLDLAADPENWGKPIGQDVLEGKRTYLLLSALERAAEEADRRLLRRVLARQATPEDVPRVRALYERLGVFEEVRSLTIGYYAEAQSAVRTLPPSQASAALEALLDSLVGRVR
ncbi:MAG: polyprenyl synthetase family protein [Bacteroidetes bacterium]|nr:polyprenyl synthetase family protein [Rhodothermia bacterium]MCS7154855.1 polyprenyl synthetase family protein [Bacteroidota bacterium]MCX7906987.1 polyprenyl synthetase family protein [Bacteroidota bacterium]MDW8137649.1 polyprenyl synthetase family protein [Bacteroidota bacterium]MDW8285397.1 polyprenyl synthetase family protein [Bacteroidota bacterium]